MFAPRYFALILLSACGSREGPGSAGFGVVTGSTASQSSGSSGSTASSSTGAAGSTGTSTGAVDTGSVGEPAGTTASFDMGLGPDLGPLQPLGCEGKKIDFLFVIDRGPLDWLLPYLSEATPKFVAMVGEKFPGVDAHFMVTVGDALWSSYSCDMKCPAPPAMCSQLADYPCEALDSFTPCDKTWGAGVRWPLGPAASNRDCGLGPRRYLTGDDPDLEEKFTCVAKVGGDGSDRVANALMGAISPALNGPGGCNEGFLRDDALLFVTLATATEDPNSEGTPEDWAAALAGSKGGDLDSIVLFGILEDEVFCGANPEHRICRLMVHFPRWSSISPFTKDYMPGFERATDMLLEACEGWEPR